MCGVVGIWYKDKQPVFSQILLQMRDVMYSRGPDDAGVWIDKEIGLGHRRLSVIDPSSLGHQPMIDEETGAVIVYNGEVYNYQEIREELKRHNIKFKSQTDTEVVLKAYRKWGKDCVNKFNGMFAFAIYDPLKKGIFVARDRIGIKPLYFYDTDKVFMFASRLSPLMLHPLCPYDIDHEALGLYFEIGFVPAPWSILKGIKKLSPGNFIWVDEKGMRESCYWNLDAIQIDNSLNKSREDELTERLDYLVRESVKSQLISDVPLGAFLSGGIDSSLIVALMRRYSNNPPKTFTVGFEEKEYDESLYARKIARYLKTDHHEKIMKSNDLLSLLDDNIKYYDEPFSDCSSLPTMMVSRFAKEQVTVSLSGDGGDELFASYHCYSIPLYLKHFYHIPHGLRIHIGNLMAKINNQRLAIVSRSFAQKDMLKSFTFIRSINREHDPRRFFTKNSLDVENLFRKRSIGFPKLDEISKFCRLDAAYYLPDDVLQKLDVASMAASLEGRVPLLDNRIVEFSLSLPLKYKLTYGGSKRLLKKVLSKYIPPELFKRPKRGFVVPIHKWFRQELKEMIRDELSASRLKQFECIDQDNVQNLIKMHLSGRYNTAQILWALLSLLRWNERFRQQKKFLV